MTEYDVTVRYEFVVEANDCAEAEAIVEGGLNYIAAHPQTGESVFPYMSARKRHGAWRLGGKG